MGDSVSHEHSAAGQNAGSTRWEIEFYEDIVKRNPDYVEVLSLLGSLYTVNKMYAKGLYVDQRLATLKKDDPIIQYNLGCSYALVNQVDRAFEALNRAIGLGYRDIQYMTHDHDLDRIRSDPRYAALVARIERAKS